jgi:hypothetical protein
MPSYQEYLVWEPWRAAPFRELPKRRPLRKPTRAKALALEDRVLDLVVVAKIAARDEQC